jgi:iduronate 2-sulfatase
MHNSGELRQYYGIPPSGSIDDDMALKLVHGYFAAVSYVDAQIGKVLDELDHLGLRESTVVILWGDHGWHLGDHGLWCKHSNFESATHSPLIIAGPGVTPDTRTAALTEFIDIYPSLCEMAGLPLPPHLEGDSFVPLLQDPRRPWKRAAYSQYPRGRNNERMGYSVRTDRYRFTRWLGGEGGHEDELYDHHADPKENVNLAADGEHRRIIDEHAALLERVIISSPDGTGTE